MKLTPNPEFLKVPADQRKKWHDALVSTHHNQGRGSLIDSDGGYCCIGIGCEAFGDAVDSDELWARWGSAFGRIMGQNPEIAVCDDGLLDAAGLNDDAELTFLQIARLVYPEAYGAVEITA